MKSFTFTAVDGRNSIGTSANGESERLKKKESVLFFSPYATATPLRMAQARLAKAYLEIGYRVYWCIDDEDFLTAFRPIEVDRVTVQREDESFCRKEAIIPIYTSDFLSEGDRSDARKAVKGLRSHNELREFTVKSVAVGRICLADALYRFKRVSLTEELIQSEILKGILLDSILSLSLLERIFERFDLQQAVVYSAGYPSHRAASIYLERQGKSVFALQGGFNYSSFHEYLRFCKADDEWTCFSRYWEILSGMPLTPNEVKYSAAHLKAVMGKSATHSFSVAAGEKSAELVRDQFGIRDGEKIVLILTSSEDEILAATEGLENPHMWDSLFADQLTWVAEVAEFAKTAVDTKFILRIHPREFADPRSEMADKWEALIETFPGNLIVNLPEDNVSLYDLVKTAALGLVSLSSAGLELMLLGVPVLRYCSSVSYPDSLGFLERGSTEGYIDAIKHTLTLDPSDVELAEQTRMAFRWNALLRYTTLIKIAPVEISRLQRAMNFIWVIRERFLGSRWKERTRFATEVECAGFASAEVAAALNDPDWIIKFRKCERSVATESEAIVEALREFLTLLYPKPESANIHKARMEGIIRNLIPIKNKV